MSRHKPSAKDLERLQILLNTYLGGGGTFRGRKQARVCSSLEWGFIMHTLSIACWKVGITNFPTSSFGQVKAFSKRLSHTLSLSLLVVKRGV